MRSMAVIGGESITLLLLFLRCLVRWMVLSLGTVPSSVVNKTTRVVCKTTSHMTGYVNEPVTRAAAILKMREQKGAPIPTISA